MVTATQAEANFTIMNNNSKREKLKAAMSGLIFSKNSVGTARSNRNFKQACYTCPISLPTVDLEKRKISQTRVSTVFILRLPTTAFAYQLRKSWCFMELLKK